MLEKPLLHDGYLVGIALRGREATFTAETVGGERWQIIIHGVQALRVDDFREGNIISYFEIVTETQPLHDAMGRLYPPLGAGVSSVYHQQHSKFFDAMCGAVQAGELALVLIQSSYGADVAVLGKSVETLRVVA